MAGDDKTHKPKTDGSHEINTSMDDCQDTNQGFDTMKITVDDERLKEEAEEAPTVDKEMASDVNALNTIPSDEDENIASPGWRVTRDGNEGKWQGFMAECAVLANETIQQAQDNKNGTGIIQEGFVGSDAAKEVLATEEDKKGNEHSIALLATNKGRKRQQYENMRRRMRDTIEEEQKRGYGARQGMFVNLNGAASKSRR